MQHTAFPPQSSAPSHGIGVASLGHALPGTHEAPFSEYSFTQHTFALRSHAAVFGPQLTTRLLSLPVVSGLSTRHVQRPRASRQARAPSLQSGPDAYSRAVLLSQTPAALSILHGEGDGTP